MEERIPTICETILQQLGGRRFIVMTGAKNFIDCGSGELSFRLPSKPGYTKDGINVVSIKLEDNDTYTMTFYRLGKSNKCTTLAKIATVDDVYCDMLTEVFTNHTGLYTRL